ncbi:MAG TPA: glycoside hydrolase family 13 protein [candidate division Zixibacteria bacterium]|nr:glycoside hydrolase family 13 protein [candidate division Zixibacteria bacterium]
MKEFIFGTLSTTEKRLDYLSEQRRGLRHQNMLEPLAPTAGISPTITVTSGKDTSVEQISCILSQPENITIPLELVRTEWDLLNWGYIQLWQCRLPSRPDGTIVRYTIEAKPFGDGPSIMADDGAVFSYYVEDPAPPDWTSEAIIYQIFPDRFHPGLGGRWNDSQDLKRALGGTLRGIIENIDYVAELGFNCIWLNPFFPDDTYHGYHASDYFSVNPRLGTKEDIAELVNQAHGKGVRVILDFVANHWGSQHPTFQAALADRSSEYYDWYIWNQWPDDYESFFSVKDLPAVNVDNPGARNHLLEAARYWLTVFDFDGYRLDYALGPSHDFWTDFRAAVHQAKPEAWIFGEVVETPETQRRYWGRLHGCLDFVLQQALRQTFAFEEMSLSAFDAFLDKHEAYFPAGYSRPSFLDNHDVNRFLWLVGGDKRKLKLASLCQFTLSGPPTVYYGTEAGLSQRRDIVSPAGMHDMAEARLPMVWGDEQDQDLLDYYRWLIHFRRQHPALWRGSRQTIHLDEEAGTYAYLRADDQETILVAMNLSDEERKIKASAYSVELGSWSGAVRVVEAS